MNTTIITKVNEIVTTYKNGTNDVKEKSTGRECYAFGLYVGGKLSKFMTANAWLTRDQALYYASGMSLAALSFKKSASIGVYRLQDNNSWQLVSTRNKHHNEHTIYKIHTSRLNGCEYIKPTGQEQTDFMSLPGWADLPINDPAALPIDWNK